MYGGIKRFCQGGLMIVSVMLVSSLLQLSANPVLSADTSVSIAEHPVTADVTFQYSQSERENPDRQSVRRKLLAGEWLTSEGFFGRQGFGLLFDYSSDNQSNLLGGLHQAGAYQHKVELIGAADGEAVVGWPGATLLVHLVHTTGSDIVEGVGAAQATSNLGSMRATRLHQAWLQQRIFNNRLSLLAGLYDLNSEFYLTPVSSLFLNSSFLVGKDFSQTGAAAFPFSALGFRVKADFPPYIAVKLAAVDAVPDTRVGKFIPDIRISKTDGVLLMGEVNFFYHDDNASSPTGTYSFGVWHYSAPAHEINRTALSGLHHETNANFGYYATGEQRVFSEVSDPRQGLNIFARFGFANGHIHRYNFNISGGVTYTGLLARRDSDKVGLALTHANNAVDYQQALRIAGEQFAPGELVVEFTYRAQITSWLVLQPDVQYVLHPGTNPEIKNATIVGSRINIGF